MKSFTYFQPTEIRFGRGLAEDRDVAQLERPRGNHGRYQRFADNCRVLPDYKNNPRIATRDEIYEMLVKSYNR